MPILFIIFSALLICWIFLIFLWNYYDKNWRYTLWENTLATWVVITIIMWIAFLISWWIFLYDNSIVKKNNMLHYSKVINTDNALIILSSDPFVSNKKIVEYMKTIVERNYDSVDKRILQVLWDNSISNSDKIYSIKTIYKNSWNEQFLEIYQIIIRDWYSGLNHF